MTNKHTETHSCDYGKKETHGDVIYRVDAMRILDEAWVDGTEYHGDLHTAFEELPSAFPYPEGFDPEHPTEQDKKDILEAMELVKKSLDCAEDGTDTNVGSSISRQAAIDLAHELIIPNAYKYGLYNQAINNYCVELVQLPSAEPEIIRCKDCEWWEKQKDSLQGRCALMQMYPTGEWFCGNAQERRTDETD